MLQLELPLLVNVSDTYVRFLDENTSHHESLTARTALHQLLILQSLHFTQSAVHNQRRNCTIQSLVYRYNIHEKGAQLRDRLNNVIF